jgi:hypothetical protein
MFTRFCSAVALAALCAGDAAAQPSQMFVYQSNFWLNLHQFLRGEIFRLGAKLPLGIDAASLDDSDRKAWASAIDAYTEIAKQDQLLSTLRN